MKKHCTAPALAAALLLTVAACDSTTPPKVIGADGAPVSPAPASPSTPASTPGGTPPSTLIGQEDALLEALKGDWHGDAVTLSIAGDSTTTLAIHRCPSVPDGPNFGFSISCAPTTFKGHFGVGNHVLVMDDGTTQTPFGVYLDGEGRLHLGGGSAFDLTGEHQVLIAPRDTETQIAVDGDHCVKAGGTPVTTALVPCTWENRDGYETLAVDGVTYIKDPSAPVIATPGVFFSVMVPSK